MNKAEEKENTSAEADEIIEESSDAQARDVSESTEGSENFADPEENESTRPEVEEKELTVEEQLVEAKQLADENYKNYLRSVADLDTYKRRVIREKDDLRQYAVSGLLESILPIYDNMELGLLSAEQNADPKVVVQGISMVLTQFQSVLSENGIEEINPEKGDAFDHNLHEAVQTQPSDEVEAGLVLQLVRKGFSLNGRLFRPATVIVSGESSE